MEIFITTIGFFFLTKNFICNKNTKNAARAQGKDQSAKKGSFLLLGENLNSANAKIIGDYLKSLQRKNQVTTEDASISQEVLGRQLIETRDKQMGPNVSVFYKQDGGLVITSGKGTSSYLTYCFLRFIMLTFTNRGIHD